MEGNKGREGGGNHFGTKGIRVDGALNPTRSVWKTSVDNDQYKFYQGLKMNIFEIAQAFD